MTRIYISATWDDLSGLHQTGSLTVQHGHAVTGGLREWYTEGNLDDLEYVAFTSAAQDALPLLAASGSAPMRRVVIAAELPDSAVDAGTGQLGDSTVGVKGPLPLAMVAAVHVDGTDAQTVVAEAAEAWELAKKGDEAAQFTVDSAADYELEWYDPSELGALLSRG